MNTSKSLDEIIRLLAVWETQAYIKREPDTPMLSRREAKQAIVEAVEGLIEPDEPYAPVDIPTFVDPNDPHQWNLKVFSENQLKARLRQAIKEWQ